MTKAETLQKYLPCHATYGDFELCVECPYNPNPGKIWEFGCVHGQDKMIDDAIALLKERDPVEPILKREGRNKFYNDYECPVCGNDICYEQNYCSECGRGMKWDDCF